MRAAPKTAPSNAVQLYKKVTKRIEQKGGTCGCYSLAMAFDTLYEQSPLKAGQTFPGLVIAAAIDKGSKLGEIFGWKELEEIVSSVSQTLKSQGAKEITLKKKEFHSEAELQAVIQDSEVDEVLMIAYSNEVFVPKKPTIHESQRAHWSLIAEYASKVTLANPADSKKLYELTVDELYKANDALQGEFNWTDFANRSAGMKGGLAEGVQIGTGKDEKARVDEVFKAGNSPQPVTQPQDLRGYVASISLKP